ncbi:MAG TPA: amidase [Gemmatimonadaceae bacterium]
MKEFSSYDGLGLANLVRTKQVSAKELISASIEIIEALNPQLNAVIHKMYDRAMNAAESPVDGPFTGVPFMLKDLLSWYEGEPIASGSKLFKGWKPPYDTEMVRRYRRSGAIVVGKTNTPEFGLTPYTEPEVFGPTLNPWNTSRTTGGSSGGSAAAVSSGMVPLAGGGDGGGSIRIPASCCGIFGLKPTRGRTPAGPLAGEHWQGAAIEHVLTRSVRDSAAMLDATSGPDVGAPYWAAPPQRPFIEEVGENPGKLRIAFTSKPLLGHTVHNDCKAALADAVTLLESLGHIVIEAEPPADRERFNMAFLTMVCGELYADLADAAQLLGRKATRDDVEYTTWALNLLGGSISAGEFVRAEHYLRSSSRRIGEFFESYDLLLTPTLSVPPFPTGSLQPPAHERAMIKLLGTLRAGSVLKLMGALEQAAEKIFDVIPWEPLFNVSGQPAMSVPLYWNQENLPIGVHIVARYGDEATLFRIASQLEEARPWTDRRPPHSA